MNRLDFDLFRPYLDDIDAHCALVSQWSVGQQIQHCLKVIERVITALETSQPGQGSPRFSFRKLLVFSTGFIPRGVAKAPEVVLPLEEVDRGELERGLDREAEFNVRLSECHKLAWFNHVVFGDLRRDQAILFMKIHNRHHEGIIKDIVDGVKSSYPK